MIRTSGQDQSAPAYAEYRRPLVVFELPAIPSKAAALYSPPRPSRKDLSFTGESTNFSLQTYFFQNGRRSNARWKKEERLARWDEATRQPRLQQTALLLTNRQINGEVCELQLPTIDLALCNGSCLYRWINDSTMEEKNLVHGIKVGRLIERREGVEDSWGRLDCNKPTLVSISYGKGRKNVRQKLWSVSELLGFLKYILRSGVLCEYLNRAMGGRDGQ